MANWLASENITGVTGKVACEHAIPSILLDPIGAALSLVVLGVVLAPFTGKYTLSAVVLDRYGPLVGGIASLMCVAGSLLWAGAQYRAVVALLQGTGLVPQAVLELLVVGAMLLWTLLGGLVADVWLDFVSILVTAPAILCIAAIAFAKTPTNTFAVEAIHARKHVFSGSAANMLAVGVFGNLFVEELAGRILLAGSPRHARIACVIAALAFGVVGFAPVFLGLWARSEPTRLLDSWGVDLCKEDQDSIISVIPQRLVPGWMFGAGWTLRTALLVESLNTVDTSVLMCAKVMETLVGRALPTFQDDPWLATSATVASLAMVVGSSKLGSNVFDLAEIATAAVGAPLAVLCIFLPSKLGGARSAGASICVAQGLYMALKCLETDEAAGMPFLCALAAGALTYCTVASMP